MKVTVIPVVIGALGTVTKGLVQKLEDLEIRGRMETILTTILLKSVRRVLATWGDLVSQTSVKNHRLTLVGKALKEVNNNINYNNNPVLEKETQNTLEFGFPNPDEKTRLGVNYQVIKELKIYWILLFLCENKRKQ